MCIRDSICSFFMLVILLSCNIWIFVVVGTTIKEDMEDTKNLKTWIVGLVLVLMLLLIGHFRRMKEGRFLVIFKTSEFDGSGRSLLPVFRPRTEGDYHASHRNISEWGRNPFILIIHYCHQAVSYTHLDVYKRQVSPRLPDHPVRRDVYKRQALHHLASGF